MPRLPPGQRAVEGFPRFGVDVSRPPPTVPAEAVIQVEGELTRSVALGAEALAGLTRRTIKADFHCVAGWSSLDLTWEGVAFAEVYDRLLAPALAPGVVVRHLAFVGADGFRSIVWVADAIRDDVLLADRLDGAALSGVHGAPVRLVSPGHYGYVNVKHLRRIELYSFQPVGLFHSVPKAQRALRVVHPHPRARVWHEERHRLLPPWLARRLYRLVRPPAPLR